MLRSVACEEPVRSKSGKSNLLVAASAHHKRRHARAGRPPYMVLCSRLHVLSTQDIMMWGFWDSSPPSVAWLLRASCRGPGWGAGRVSQSETRGPGGCWLGRAGVGRPRCA
jgi:hypothetical protein